jgi:endoglucanase
VRIAFAGAVVCCLLATPVAAFADRETTHRGVNVVLETLSLADLEILATEWNANLIRVHLGVEYNCGHFVFDRSDFTEEECCANPLDLEKLDSVMDACEALGIRVLLDLVQFPGYRYIGEEDFTLWTDADLQSQLIRFWRSIAERYSSRGDVVYGYDLLNEPRGGDPSAWNDLSKRITDAIREVDAAHSIVLECAEYAEPYGFTSLVPTGDENTIYSFHLWEPGEFTDQGKPGYSSTGVAWPPAGLRADFLESWVQPVAKFQKEHDVRILVGEVGVTVWAPPEDRAAYIGEAFGLFEKHGFDYTYWAYGAWPDFSLEHSGYLSESGRPMSGYVGETPVLSVVREYFSRNEMHPGEGGVEQPICLFDTAHWGKEASELQYVLDIAWRAATFYEVSFRSEGSITSWDLETSNLLVTGNPYGGRYSSSEIAAVQDFVRQGGSLLLYLNSGLPAQWVDPLLSLFGIAYFPAQVRSSTPPFQDEDSRNFWIHAFNRTHPIGENATPFYMTFAGSFDVEPPAMAIATSDSGAWRDENRDGLLNSGEVSGSLAMVAAAEYGAGRVVAFANDYFGNVCNAKLLLAALNWLSR